MAAPTITVTTLVEGLRNLVLLVDIIGNSSDVTAATLVTRANYSSMDGKEFVVEKLEGELIGFSAALLFDATTALVFARLAASDFFEYDWNAFGGISSNKSGAGATGNILITTSGLTTGSGNFVLEMRKN